MIDLGASHGLGAVSHRAPLVARVKSSIIFP